MWPNIETHKWLTYEEDKKTVFDYEELHNKVSMLTADELDKFFSWLDEEIAPCRSYAKYKSHYISIYSLIDWLEYSLNIFWISGAVDEEPKPDSNQSIHRIWMFWFTTAANNIWCQYLSTASDRINIFPSTEYVPCEWMILILKIRRPSDIKKLNKDEYKKLTQKDFTLIEDLDDEIIEKAMCIKDMYYWVPDDDDDDDNDDVLNKNIAALPFMDWPAWEEQYEWHVSYSSLYQRLHDSINTFFKDKEIDVLRVIQAVTWKLKDELWWIIWIEDKTKDIYFKTATWVIWSMTAVKPFYWKKIKIWTMEWEIELWKTLDAFLSSYFYIIAA